MSMFTAEVGNGINPTPEKPIIDTLFEEYERVIFQSIITAFGLDMFIKDRHGGDVDTIHNVRNGVEYKDKKNESDYINRGDYNYPDYHEKNAEYRKTIRDARAGAKDNGGVITDAYTGGNVAFSKSAPSGSKASLDHVIPAKVIHDDKGRILSGLNGTDLANSPENLVYTNQSLNSSMNASEIPKYIEKNPDLPEDVKRSMMDHYNKAKSSYEKKLATAYYFDLSNPNCRRFYFNTATAAVKTGFKMGARQVLGFVLTEVWFSVRDSLRSSGNSMSDKISAIVDGIKYGFEIAKEKYKEIIEKFGEGIVAGVMSSLTTTICNTFFTTGKNLIRIIRQAWASIVEATKIIFFNPGDLYFCDRMTNASKVLAAGAGIIIGTSVQELVSSNLKAVPEPLCSIISTFSGSLCTGLLTISFLFYIDNNPFNAVISKVFDETLENYKLQAALFRNYCAELQSLDVERFENEVKIAYDLISQLSETKTDEELNAVLLNATKAMGVDIPWGGGDINDFMKDPNTKMIFKI